MSTIEGGSWYTCVVLEYLFTYILESLVVKQRFVSCLKGHTIGIREKRKLENIINYLQLYDKMFNSGH